MVKIHFLNVKQGDCFLMERSSKRLTMIDICGGNLSDEYIAEAKMRKVIEKKPRGNFNMCSTPTNPISYLKRKDLNNIWRFILTHPDMDHMDGLKKLFREINVTNFWDNGVRKEKPDFNEGNCYLEEDWDFYEDLINNRVDDTNVIRPLAGDEGKYWNDDDQENGNGDYIYIVAPDEDLITQANDSGDVNDSSYVIVYNHVAGKIIFSGDSSNKTWEYILNEHKDLVSDAGVLFAPHHGRKSDMDFSFLDVVNPRVTFFGCASSGHLAYSAWQNRNLLYFTNNQCGNVHLYPSGESIDIYIENYTYAKAYNNGKPKKKDEYWYLDSI